MQEEKERLGLARSAQGTIVTATVKGDVHDIGKNIVGVVLGCNNYRVVDLGVMAPAETILDTAEREKRRRDRTVDLTPSLTEMVNVATEMTRRGVTLPLLIGGATTSKQHTAVKYFAPVYCSCRPRRDVLPGRGVMSALLDEPRKLDADNRKDQERLRKLHEEKLKTPLLPYRKALENRLQVNWQQEDSPPPPFVGTRTVEPDLAALRDYIDWTFFLHGLGVEGELPRQLLPPPENPSPPESCSRSGTRCSIASCLSTSWRPAASTDTSLLMQWATTSSSREAGYSTASGSRPIVARGSRTSPSRYSSRRSESGVKDHVGAFAVSAGFGADELAEGLRGRAR